VAREIEAGGIPVVQVSSVPDVVRQVGGFRIVWGQGIPFPLGNAWLPLEQQKAFRMAQMKKAIEALETKVTKPTFFRAAFGNVIGN
jgi:glycine/betaine/sarcosine/D-proline reductase family selenoprotein B